MKNTNPVNVEVSVINNIKYNGGCTVKFGEVFNSDKGYAVSFGNICTIENYNSTTAYQTILNCCKLNTVVGFWLDGTTLYIDAIWIVPNEELALELAESRGQITIYDFKHKVDITLKGGI